MADSDRSISSSVVAHELTLIRIATRPRHTVPAPALAIILYLCDDPVRSPVTAEADNDLVQDDIVQHFNARLVQRRCHFVHLPAIPFHEFR